MRKQNMLSLEELERLIAQPFTCFHKVRQALHVTLHPRYLNNLELGLLDYFNKQINRWHPKLNGILANYGKLKLKSPHGMLMNEEAHIHLDVVSDFWVFRPEMGAILQGTVTKTSQKHVACLVHGVFNVPCYHPNNLGSIPWWGINAQIGKVVRFKVIKMDVSQKIPFILGELEKWNLDGNPVTSNTLNIEQPVEEIGPDRWEQVAREGSQKEESNKAFKGQGKISLMVNGVGESPIPANLLPLKPLGQEVILNHIVQEAPAAITPIKAKKGAKTATKKKVTSVDLSGLNSIPSPTKPPNIDDLIKSIKMPAPQTGLSVASVVDEQNNVIDSKTSPKKKPGVGEAIKRQCSFCDHIMPKKGIKNHIISAHFKEKLLAKIPSCGPGKSGPYQCPKCEKSQKDRTDILRHFANAHNEILEHCTEDQLQGREISDPSAAQKIESICTAMPSVVTKTETDSTPKETKKKKQKKEKSSTTFESFAKSDANSSNLISTSATPIRNAAVENSLEDNTFSISESKKKKKKKNKEKDKEAVQLNGKGTKRDGDWTAEQLETTIPPKKSKSTLKDNDLSMDAATHKKTKKKKKDKKKSD